MTERGSVVAVVAHPDDESLIAGGTLALAARAGADCGVVALTRGELGPISDAALATPATLGDVREAELGAAARLLGASWSACLRHPDGELPWADRDGSVDELAAALAPHAPTVLLTFGADGVYGHHDHAAAGEIAAAALERLGTPASLYESVWAPGLVSELAAAAAQRGLATGLWDIEPEAFGSRGVEATLVLDVRPVLDSKLAALRAHRTQLGPGHLLAALPGDLAERFLAHEAWRLVCGEDRLAALKAWEAREWRS